MILSRIQCKKERTFYSFLCQLKRKYFIPLILKTNDVLVI